MNITFPYIATYRKRWSMKIFPFFGFTKPFGMFDSAKIAGESLVATGTQVLGPHPGFAFSTQSLIMRFLPSGNLLHNYGKAPFSS